MTDDFCDIVWCAWMEAYTEYYNEAGQWSGIGISFVFI